MTEVQLEEVLSSALMQKVSYEQLKEIHNMTVTGSSNVSSSEELIVIHHEELIKVLKEFTRTLSILKDLILKNAQHIFKCFSSGSFLNLLQTKETALILPVLTLLREALYRETGFVQERNTEKEETQVIILHNLVLHITSSENDIVIKLAVQCIINLLKSNLDIWDWMTPQDKHLITQTTYLEHPDNSFEFEQLKCVVAECRARSWIQNKSAVKIQQYWKMYRQRRREEQKRKVERNEEKERFWAEKRRELARRAYYENHMKVLQSIPAENFHFYLDEKQNTAALRIQSMWRGYATRKRFWDRKEAMLRDKSAIIIQRAVRHWLHTRKEGVLTFQQHMLDRIPEDRLLELQKEVQAWQKKHKVKNENQESLEELHHDVQSRLVTFYLQTSTRPSREQHDNSLCAQVKTICTLLESAPALSSSDEKDLSFYHCLSLPLATKARMKHKEEMKKINLPWWKRLDTDDSINGSF